MVRGSRIVFFGTAAVIATFVSGSFVHAWSSTDGVDVAVREASSIAVASAPVSLSLGGETTCEVSAANQLRCWGSGAHGLLGGAVSTSTPVIIAVPNETQDPPRQVAVGSSHACVLTESQVYCWGDNQYGQLGDGSEIDSSTPVVVSGLTALIGEPRSVAVGEIHSCALGSNEKVACWGANRHLSLSTTAISPLSHSTVPVLAEGTMSNQTSATLSPLAEVRQISLLDFGGCALVGAAGQVLCWGRNLGSFVTGHELGLRLVNPDDPFDDPQLTVARPVSTDELNPSAPGMASAVAVASYGRHSCAIMSAGTVKCWGVSQNAEAGYTQTIVSPPHQVTGVESAVSLALGQNHSCVRRADGRVQCWGGNFFGQLLGLVGDDESSSAVYVAAADGQAMNDAASVSAGGFATCVVRTNGEKVCAGRNTHGQLGQTAPTDELSGVRSFDMGQYFGCAVVESREVRCWGVNNGSLQLGQPLRSDSYADRVQTLPVRTAANEIIINAEEVAAGANFACARLVTKRVVCWGSNHYGQLGRGSSYQSSGSAGADFVVGSSGQPLEDVVDIDVGSVHGCALNSVGVVHCWGYNEFGQVGNPNSVSLGSDKFVSLGLGYYHSCATTRDGAAYCWGRGDGYQLGTGQRHGAFGQPGSTVPLRVAYSGLTTKIVGSEQGGCLLGDVGEVHCWGFNSYGQAGGDPNGSNFALVSPRRVAGTSDAVDLAMGDYHTCAVKSDGSTWCWGNGIHGQIGNGVPGLLTPSNTRVQTRAMNAPLATAVSTGKDGTCVLSLDSTISCWGVADWSIHEFGSGGTYDDWAPGFSPRHLLPTKVLRAKPPGLAGVSADWSSSGTLTVETIVTGNLDPTSIVVTVRDGAGITSLSTHNPISVFRCSCPQRFRWSTTSVTASSVIVVVSATNSVGTSQSVSPTVTRPAPSTTTTVTTTTSPTPNPPVTVLVTVPPAITARPGSVVSPPTGSTTTTPLRPGVETVVAAPPTARMALKVGKSATSASLAKAAKIPVGSGSKVSLTVAGSSRKVCRVSGSSVRMTRPGACKVAVKVSSRNGARITRTVTVTVR